MDDVRYRVVVEGELGPRYAAAFDGMRMECSEGRTAIIGMVRDQSHLQGLVDHIATLGLTLISVVPEDDE